MSAIRTGARIFLLASGLLFAADAALAADAAQRRGAGVQAAVDTLLLVPEPGATASAVAACAALALLARRMRRKTSRPTSD